MVKLSAEVNMTGYSYQGKVLWHDVFWMSCQEAEHFVNEIFSKHDDAIVVSYSTVKYHIENGYCILAINGALTR